MSTKKKVLSGRAWFIGDGIGSLINDIDTDMIFHNAHLAITDVNEMGKFTFGNLDGWRDFPKKVGEGDIVIAGTNFGCGSSRQHAVDCFRALGVQALIVASVGAIYKRNAINSGFPLVICPEIENSGISSGDSISINLETGEIASADKKKTAKGIPFSRVQMDIYQAGSLFDVRGE